MASASVPESGRCWRSSALPSGCSCPRGRTKAGRPPSRRRRRADGLFQNSGLDGGTCGGAGSRLGGRLRASAPAPARYARSKSHGGQVIRAGRGVSRESLTLDRRGAGAIVPAPCSLSPGASLGTAAALANASAAGVSRKPGRGGPSNLVALGAGFCGRHLLGMLPESPSSRPRRLFLVLGGCYPVPSSAYGGSPLPLR
jgi:hypothetical protein